MDKTNFLDAQKFVNDWLWSSPDRRTVGQEWKNDRVCDVAQMLVEYLEAQRRREDP